jgi:predicted acylesterase/phospholipase RssA
MPLDVNDFRFWRAFRSVSAKQMFRTWDFLTAVSLGVLSSFLYSHFVPQATTQVAVAGDFVAIAGALFGVVIAGFAIAAALLDERYARALRAKKQSSYNLLRHFLVEGGLLVTSLTVTLIYRAIAQPVYTLSHLSAHLMFGAAVFFFFWSLFGALQLMTLVLGVAVTSTELFSVPKDERDTA